jgi:TRAP-type mannitol/chloroaromatic compound transport system permease small subunit
LSKKIDAMNERIGRAALWLVLVVVLLSTFNAIMRYTVKYSSNAFLEAQWYLFGMIFMSCSGYTLLHGAHVRVDVLLERLSARARIWIDIFGILFFLMPMSIGSMLLSWPVFLHTFNTGEMSNSPGGLIVWPARLMIPMGFLLIMLQGISELIKHIASLKGGGAASSLPQGEPGADTRACAKEQTE